MRRPLAIVVAVALAAGVAVAAVAASNYRPFAASADQAVIVQRAHAGAAAPSFNKRLTFLVIGSDSGAPKFGRGGSVGPLPIDGHWPLRSGFARSAGLPGPVGR